MYGHPTNIYVSEGFANWGGPKTAGCVSPAPYTNSALSTPAGPGATGGSIAVGGRSFTIWSWDGTAAGALTEVFDSGDLMETMQTTIAGGLCSGCSSGTTNTAGNACADYCPFNSDESPPKMDDRSDAKGAEPECVTTGALADGTVLSFVGMERTGGILVHDITNPGSPVFQVGLTPGQLPLHAPSLYPLP